MVSLDEWRQSVRAIETRERWDLEQERLLQNLFEAIENNDRKALEEARAKGVPFNLPLHNQITALGLAASQGNVTMMQALLDLGAVVGVTFGEGERAGQDAAWLALDAGHNEAFAMLMNRGASPNLRLRDSQTTRLMAAVDRSNLSAVQQILSRRPKINARDRHGRTALHVNLSKDPYAQEDMLIGRLLLAENADPNVEDLEGVPAHALANTGEKRILLEQHELSVVSEKVLQRLAEPSTPEEDEALAPPPPDMPPPGPSSPSAQPGRKPRARL